MNFIKLLIVLGFLTKHLVYAQIPDPEMEKFAQIYEKFYLDLGKRDFEAIKPLVISVAMPNNFVYGEALTRNETGPFGICSIFQIANPDNFSDAFKRITKLELVTYRFLLVRYRYPEKYQKQIKKTRLVLKYQELEENHCDLWIYASDMKWYVACDFSPGVSLDRQSLGLILTDDLEFSKKEQLKFDASRIFDLE